MYDYYKKVRWYWSSFWPRLLIHPSVQQYDRRLVSCNWSKFPVSFLFSPVSHELHFTAHTFGEIIDSSNFANKLVWEQEELPCFEGDIKDAAMQLSSQPLLTCHTYCTRLETADQQTHLAYSFFP
jgi:hypothetical protein